MLHVVPVVLGAGENLWHGLDPQTLEVTEVIDSPTVTHHRYRTRR